LDREDLGSTAVAAVDAGRWGGGPQVSLLPLSLAAARARALEELSSRKNNT